MRRKVDMINGSLPVNMIRFVIPVLLTGVLQLLFNACDLVVVGQFAGPQALAAVGATGALINLFVNAFIGLSVGVNVLAAQAFGARDFEKADSIVHTAVSISLICGVIIGAAGIFLSRPCLEALNTPADVIDLSVLYMRIYCGGIPASVLYNFGAAILRAQGNTKHPLMFLTIAGVINVILNLIFVLFFDMSVDGVAIATVASQVVSAVLVVLYLRDPSVVYNLKLRKLRVDFGLLKSIFRIGIPSSLNSMVFSFANMQIQASVNLFGSAAMAGCSAGANIEGFIYTAMNSIHQGALNFTGQNIGAGNKTRLPKILLVCLGYVTLIGIVLGCITYLFKEPLLRLYVTDSASVAYGVERMNIISTTYFLCGCMEVFTGVLRGRGCSLAPMVISLLGACGLRLVWIATVFQWFFSLRTLYLSFPVSWVVTSLALYICYLIVVHRDKKRDKSAAETAGIQSGESI